MSINFKDKNGFTLVELIFVLFLISLLFTLSLFYFNTSKYKLKKDVYVLYTNLVKARDYAIRFRKTQKVEFFVNEKKYVLTLFKYNETVQEVYFLSNGVEFGDGNHSDTSYHTVKFGQGTVANFSPEGFCMPSGGIYLKTANSNDNVYKIKITLAGDIQIYKWNGSSWIR